ncbi:MBL fold metallo-hydrolase [Paenibacillus sp. Z3-2]
MISIADKVSLLELDMFFLGKHRTIHPILIQDGNSIILIDAGLPQQFEHMENEMLNAGISAAQLTHILITHQDLDHIGCLPELSAVNASASICAHNLDAPYIRGDEKLIKDNIVPWQSELNALPSSRVDQLLSDHEKMNIGGGIKVIHTPGHTDGHVSFLLEETGQLVVGDALFYIEGQLIIPGHDLTVNVQEAIYSLEKLLTYEFDELICYHGGICTDGKNQIKTLLNSLD